MLHITVTSIDSSQLWREQQQRDRAALTYALRREFEHVLLPWWEQPENKGTSKTALEIAAGLALPIRRDMESCTRRISAWLDNDLIEVDTSAKPIVNGRPRTLYRLSSQAYEIVRKGPKTVTEQREWKRIRKPRRVRSKTSPDMPTLYEVWVSFHNDRKLTAKSVRTYESLLERCLWDYHDEPVTAWTPELVEHIHGEVTKMRGPTQANMCMRFLSALLNYSALKFGIVQLRVNPVKRLSALRKWNKETRRTNRLKVNEYGPYLYSLKSIRDNPASTAQRCCVVDWFELLLFTGMRRDEGRLLTWEDVNFAERYFKIPDTKNRRTHVLPMSEHVFNLFRRRWMAAKPRECIYVFPGRSAKKPIASGRMPPGSFDRRIAAHDLRRSFAAAAKKAQVSTEVIGQLLNHMTTSLTLRYMGDDDIEELREPMERISQFILHHAAIPSDVLRVTVVENAPLLIQDNVNADRTK